MTKTLLQKGDKLIYSQHNEHRIVEIDRLTPKRAYCGDYCFNIEISAFMGKPRLVEIGRGTWARHSFDLYSKELWVELCKTANERKDRRALSSLLSGIRRSEIEEAPIEKVRALADEIRVFLGQKIN